MIRTEGLKATCVGMYIVHCRVIVDNKCEFQQSSSPVDCNLDARLVSKTLKYRSTKKLRKHVCQLILVSTIQSVQAWPTASRPVQSVEAITNGSCTTTARSSGVHGLLKSSRQGWRQSVFTKFRAASCPLLCFSSSLSPPVMIRSS